MGNSFNEHTYIDTYQQDKHLKLQGENNSIGEDLFN